MGEVVLEVPAEHLDSFRMGVLADLSIDAGNVGDNAEAAWVHYDEGTLPGRVELVDLRSSVRYLAETASILDQAFIESPGDVPLTIRGKVDALAHVTETMARQVVEPLIREEMKVGPFDAKSKAAVAHLSDSLDWATANAARLHEQAGVERQQARAEQSAKVGAD